MFLASHGQVLVICVNYQHRANDVASFARELLPRTFGFAMGSAAVFVPQVEVFEFRESVAFQGSGLSFLWEFEFVVWSTLSCRSSGLSHFRCVHLSGRRRGRLSSRRFSNRTPFWGLVKLDGFVFLLQSDGKAR